MRTREEDRVYRAQLRARKKAEAAAPDTDATILQMPPPKPITDVQDGVKAELAGLPATTSHPGLVAAAMSMARILDDPKSALHHPSAARALGDCLA
jgi:hypothetical protein